MVSHEQALRQCKEALAEMYPHAVQISEEDTALAARKLKMGELPETVVVICSKSAGLGHNLCLIRENIEDARDNCTTFGLFKFKK